MLGRELDWVSAYMTLCVILCIRCLVDPDKLPAHPHTIICTMHHKVSMQIMFATPIKQKPGFEYWMHDILIAWLPQGTTPLHYAAFSGMSANLKMLLNHGADVKAKDKKVSAAYSGLQPQMAPVMIAEKHNFVFLFFLGTA